MKASGDLHSALTSSTGVYQSASIGSLSNLQFIYYVNSYNYNVPLEMNNEVVGTMLDDRYYFGSIDNPYNVRLSFPSSLLGTRITGTWHIPLSLYSRYTFYYYDYTNDVIENFPAATMDLLSTDLTYRSSVSVSDNSFPSGVSVSLTDRTYGSYDWVDLVVTFDDYLLPSNFYANYFSFDLTFHTDFQVFVSSLAALVPEELRQLSAATCEATLNVRSSAYASYDIVLTLPQIGNATNSQLYYDVLAAINNANISYDITVDGTDVTVDIDTSSLAQQTTVANILTVLNNIKSDSSSIPALSSNFSTFATAALTYLGNISAGSDVISDVLESVISIYDRLGVLSSELSSIYNLLSSNFSDYLNSVSLTPYTSSYSFSDSLPASFSSLIGYHYRLNRSPSVSSPASFNVIQSYGISGVFSDYTTAKVLSLDYLTGSLKVYSPITLDHCTVRKESDIYYWDFSLSDYPAISRDIYFISNLASYGTGSVNQAWVRGSVLRLYPSDQTITTSAAANSFLATTPFVLYFFDDSFVSEYSTVSIDSFAPRTSLTCNNGVIGKLSYVLSTIYPYNNLSSLIASYVVGFTGITSNSVTDLSSISQNTFNRWVSIIQQAISTQLNTGSGGLSIEASLAASDVDYLHSQIETPLWEDVASKLDDIEDFLGTVPSGVPSAAVWFVGLIEDVWDALGPFGYVLGTSLVVGFIVILFGVINHFPRGSTSDDSIAYRYDSDSGTWKHL